MSGVGNMSVSGASAGPTGADQLIMQQAAPPTQQQPQPPSPHHQHQPPSPQPEEEPQLRHRGISRKEQIKNYVKRETAMFFGIEQDHQEDQRQIWHERRLRLAERRYGPLRQDQDQDADIRYRLVTFLLLLWLTP